MFDHLDDPARFVPDDEFRQGVYRKGRRIRLAHRAAKVAGGLAATVVVVGLAGTLYVDRRDSAIDRVEVAAQPSTDGAINVLLIGTDSSGEPPVEAGFNRADTIVVVRLNTDGSIGLLSLPRDLWIGDGQRLNATLEDGPQGVVTAVTESTGLPVDHYIEVDYAGLTALVDGAGGLPLAVNQTLVDPSSGLFLSPSACVTLDGETALALARARHIDGDLTSDLGRMARARTILGAALVELGRAGSDAGRIDEVTRALADHAVLDDDLTLDRLADIAGELAQRSEAGAVVSSPDLPLVDLMTEAGSFLGLPADAIGVLHDFGTPEGFQLPEVPGGGSGGTGEPSPVAVPGADPAIGPCEQAAG